MNRRALLQSMIAAAGVAAFPSRAFGQTAAPWTLGFSNAPAAGVAPEPMDLIHGRAPAGLEGVLFRNGPGWFRYPDGSGPSHWFDGDGLIRRFAVADGQATLAARFVETPKHRAEMAAGRALMPGFGTAADPAAVVDSPDDTNAANTAVLPVNGQIWALWEAGSPFAVDPGTLETRGVQTLRPDLAAMPFLAHPKIEPSGRIWNIGLSGSRAIVWRLAPDGTLEDAQLIRLPRPDYIHDWAMTERHLLILLQPWTMTSHSPPFINTLQWNADAPFLIVAIPKDDLTQQRVFEAPAMAFFHTGDAFEEADGTIRVDLCPSPDPTWATTAAHDLLRGVHNPLPFGPHLVQLALRPSGRTDLIDTGVQGEFPQTDKRRQGLRRALTVLASDSADGRPLESAVTLWDWEAGRGDRYSFGAHQMVEEMLMVPYGPDERDCWLIGPTLNLTAQATELHVLDARRLSDGPVASWRARRSLPLGFHGCWVG